jgi:PAS domain S-box-containing protein
MSSADRRETIGAFQYWLHTWPRRYGFALVAVAAATLLRYAVGVALGLFPPFILYVPAILLVALLAGFGPGTFATLLSTASVAYFFWSALNLFGTNRVGDIVGLGVFSVLGVAVSGLADMYRRREARLQEFERAVEGVEEMIVVVDRDYRCVIANRAYLSHRGITREEMIDRPIQEILNPGVFETTLKEKLDECIQGKVVQFEMQYKYPERGERDLFISYFPIDGAGRVDRVAGVLQDITERKRTKEALQGSEKRFRAVYERSPVGIALVDKESGHFLDVNPKFCEILGRSEEEVLKLDFQSVTHPDDLAESLTKRGDFAEGRSAVFELEKRYCRPDGAEVWAQVNVAPMWREQEPHEVYLVMAQDITERKQTENVLRESEDRYRDLVENSQDLVCTHDLEGRFLSVNPAPARLLGYKVAELMKMPMREFIAPEAREQFDAYLERIKTTGADQGLLCVLARNGERKIWEYKNTLRTEGVAFPIVRGMARDITERKRAESAQRSSERQYRMLFEKTVAGVGIINMEGQVIDCNDAWAHMFGHDRATECRGRQIAECYPDPAERELLVCELKRSGAFFNRELQLRRADGTQFWVLLNSVLLTEGQNPPLIQSTILDITERKRAEDALRRREEDYRSFVAQSSEGIFREDLDAPVAIDLPEEELIHHIIHDSYMAECNDAMARMYGFTSGQELLGKRLAEMLVADDPNNIEMTREYIRSGFKVLDRESHEVDIHGDPKVFRNSIIGIVENGKLVRTWGIQRDVTEQVRAEEGQRAAEQSLRQNEERFRVALKDSPITVFSQDRELRYTWIYNPQLYWQHDAIGRTDAEIIGPKKAAGLADLKRRVLKTGTASRAEVVIPNDGKSYAFDLTIEPLFDANGSVIGITGATMDIARLRELTDRLQDARDRLAQEKSYLESEIQTELGFEEIIGQSTALREVLKNVRVVAPTDSTVLLLGETGTGKELVARSVHGLSSRHDKTFIKLNCAAVPSGLLESELFGHEKGAFTGAISQKVGRIELADKGTLFLDEIGELPLELQPKLLRVLQDREFERLGGVHTLHVDVRIISATNRDLRQDIADRKFREDLFYRLNVFPIDLPSLRERRTDIPILVHHFVRKHSARMGKHIDVVPDETMIVLQNWSWPGNIRELENMIERMVILSKGRVLAAPPVELDAPEEITEDNLTQMERDHIIRVLRETHGVLSGTDGAASRLGMKRTTLQSMLKRFGIELQEYRHGNGTFGPG